MASSSFSGQDPPSVDGNGQPSPQQQQPSSTTVSRRLPPPCWSPDETVALIDAYRDKWYSLRRGNLRATHWQDVADAVAVRCPVDPTKTSVQCRHKMEKLRKRYRAEIQRAYATPSGRYCSSWVHFKRMDGMEKGPVVAVAEAVPFAVAPIERYEEEEEDEDEQEDPEDFYSNSVRHGVPYNSRKFYGSMGNGIGGSGGNGFRIKIPGRSNMGQSAVKSGSKYDEFRNYEFNSNLNFGNPSKVFKDGYTYGLGNRSSRDGSGKRKEGNNNNAFGEMVSAIKSLGDGFARMERMKMEMAREVEAMRMEMEMKRTEMILESQQRIVEALVKAFSEKNKKVKRIPTPES